MNEIKVSLILPCYFRPHLLKWGLYSISKQKILYPFEILILNDGIPDETENVCKSFPNLNIKYYFTGERNLKEITWRVPGIIFNKGVKLAEGNIIILSSPEIFHINEDSINQLIKPLENQSKILVIPEEGKDDDKGFYLMNLERKKDISYNDLKTKLNTELNFCMAMNKQDFLDINGFDPIFFEGYCFDDNDFIERLLYNGCKYYKVPIKIIHLFNSRKAKDRIGLQNRDELWLKNKKIYEYKRKLRCKK
jgi:hypothetical protein